MIVQEVQTELLTARLNYIYVDTSRVNLSLNAQLSRGTFKNYNHIKNKLKFFIFHFLSYYNTLIYLCCQNVSRVNLGEQNCNIFNNHPSKVQVSHFEAERSLSRLSL